MAFQGHKASISVSGTPIATTGEATTTSDNQNYQITDSAKQMMAMHVDVTVYEDAVETTEAYTISRINGTIKFETVDAGRGAITADYSYVTTSNVAEAHEYSVTINQEMHTVTPFLSEWVKLKPGLQSAEGSLEDFDVEDTYFEDALIAGNAVVIELYPNDGEDPLKMFALLDSTELSKALTEAQGRSVSFQSTQKMIGFA